MAYRHGNTGREMTDSGEWARVGRKHYRHISGTDVRYDCNRWAWEVVGQTEWYSVLWAAKRRVERVAEACEGASR